MPKKKFVTLQDFDGQEVGDLTFFKGEILTILSTR